MLDCYKQVKKNLLEGRYVLFSGTPCQVAGLRLFLKKDYEKLLSIDFICHGVPSPMLLKKHLAEVAGPYNSEAVDIRFRNKEKNWKKCTTTYVTLKDKRVVQVKNDPYMLAFLQNLSLRPSCHNCAANNHRSGADFTIGDYWGCETKYRAFDDERGVSLLMPRTNKAEAVLNEVKGMMEIIEADFPHVLMFNKNIIKSTGYNKSREDFFRLVREGSVPFSQSVKKCLKPHIEMARNFLTPRQIRFIQFCIARLRGR
jgi:coenzyme F420-reducing hydrogenase beta subunit